MPVPNGTEKEIKIYRTSSYNPTWPSQNEDQQFSNSNQQEARAWSSHTMTKRTMSTSNSASSKQNNNMNSVNFDEDLFSNALLDRKGSNTPVFASPPSLMFDTNSANRRTSLKSSSSLVKNAFQEIEDGSFGNERDSFASLERELNQKLNQLINNSRRDSQMSRKVAMSTNSSFQSGKGNWDMGADAGGDVPGTYNIVTKADGTKEFQVLLSVSNYFPDDLQVKLTDNRLYISGTHEERAPNGTSSQKSFYRWCMIPQGVRMDELNCSLDSSNRLRITAPVRE